MAPNRIALIYITCKNNAEARKIAKALVYQKLIACANSFPISSMYQWKRKMKNSREIVLIAKTKPSHYDAVQQVVKELHSYDIPCIMRIDAVANEPYYKWLMKEMK